MKIYENDDFIKLPANTIYSRVFFDDGKYVIEGMYCKTSGAMFSAHGNSWEATDWYETDLIGQQHNEQGKVDVNDAMRAFAKGKEPEIFRTNLEGGCRDGMFDPGTILAVWDLEDIESVISYLQKCCNSLKKQ